MKLYAWRLKLACLMRQVQGGWRLLEMIKLCGCAQHGYTLCQSVRTCHLLPVASSALLRPLLQGHDHLVSLIRQPIDDDSGLQSGRHGAVSDGRVLSFDYAEHPL